MKTNIFIYLFLVLFGIKSNADFSYTGSNTINMDWDQTVSATAPIVNLTFNYVATGSNMMSPTLSGTDAAKFKISTNRCDGNSAKTCILSLTLNRITTAGTYTAVLNLQNSTPSSFNLSTKVTVAAGAGGGATTPQIAFTPATLSQFLFDTYSSQTVNLTLKNTGTVAITSLSAVSWSTTSSNLSISVDRCSNQKLAVGATCTISVLVKKPVAAGVVSNLSIIADAKTTASIGFDLLGQTPCTFNGTTYQNGATITGYSSATVPFGSTCSSVAVSGVCQSGTINPAVASATCTVQAAARCTVDGKTFASGASISGFSAKTVPFGQTCAPLAVSGTCQNGTVSPSVTALTCTVDLPATCSFNGQTIQHGASVSAYQSASVPFGSTCSQETRTCTNGVLSGSFTNSTCSVQPAATCSFGGKTYQNGQYILGYSVATVPYGQTCSAFTTMGLCQNGTITTPPASATCTETPALTCDFNGQTIQSGSTINAYQTATVPFGSTCKKEVRGCTNGVLTGSYTNSSCVVDPGATCSFNGQTIQSGSSVVAYQSSTVAFGSTCSQETRTCINGVLSGSNTFASCAVDQPLTCSFGGQTYQHGDTVNGFSSATATFANKCSSVATSGTCQNGTITNQPAFSSCLEDAPRSCTYNQQIIPHGSLASGYTQASAPSGSSCSVYATTSLCDDGTLVSPPASATCYVAFPEWVAPTDPQLAVCQGSTSLQSTLVCHKDLISGEIIPNTECSAATAPAPTVFQSPAGNVVDLITNGSETKSCPVGSTTKTFVSRSCDNGYFDNGTACISATYTATYSSYSPDPSTIQPCQGNVVSTRTILSCKRDSDQAVVANSFCSDSTPTITTPSPVGYFNQSISNGVVTNQCAVGSTQQTFYKRTCAEDYYSTTQNASGSCSLRTLMYTGTRMGDYEVTVESLFTSTNIGITNGSIGTTKDVKGSGFVSNWIGSFYNNGYLGTLNDRYLFLSLTDFSNSSYMNMVAIDRTTNQMEILNNTGQFPTGTNFYSTILTRNFGVSDPLNGYVYYKSNNPSQLIKSNGTAAGTSVVKTFSLFNLGQEIVVFGNYVFFIADNGTNGFELWKSDGTTAGTVMVQDLNPGAGNMLKSGTFHSETTGGIAVLNNKLFFAANNGTTSGIYYYNFVTETISLFMADDTTNGGLTLIKSNYNSDKSLQKRYFDNSKMYIAGKNGQLYVTDGTATGTTTIMDGSTGDQKFGAKIGFSSDRFYFSCLDLRLYVFAVCSVDSNNVVRNFSNFNDDIVDLENFGSSPGYVYNSSEIIDQRAANDNQDSKGGAFVGNDYYFMVDNNNNGNKFSMGELFKISNDQLYAVKQITPIVFGSKSISNISTGMYYGLGYNNKLYFTTESSTGRELWVSDGTAAGTVMYEINSTVYSGTQISADIRYMTGYNGKVYFTANRPLTPNSRSVNPDPRTNYYYMPVVFDPANGSTTELFDRTATGNGDPTSSQRINNFFKF